MGVGSIARIARTIRKYSWLSAQSMWTLCNTILQTCLWWLNLFDDHISPKYDRYLLFSLIMWLSFSCKCLALNHDHYHDDLYEAKAWLTEQPVWGRSRSAGPPFSPPIWYQAISSKWTCYHYPPIWYQPISSKWTCYHYPPIWYQPISSKWTCPMLMLMQIPGNTLQVTLSSLPFQFQIPGNILQVNLSSLSSNMIPGNILNYTYNCNAYIPSRLPTPVHCSGGKSKKTSLAISRPCQLPLTNVKINKA